MEFIDYLFRVINMLLIPKIKEKEKHINEEIINFIEEKILEQFPNKDKENIHLHLSTIIPFLRLFIIERTCTHVINPNSKQLGELLHKIKRENPLQNNHSEHNLSTNKNSSGDAFSERNITDIRKNILIKDKYKSNEESKLDCEEVKLCREKLFSKKNEALDEIIPVIKETIRQYEMMVVDFSLKNNETSEIEDLIETLRLYLKKMEIKREESRKAIQINLEKPIEEKKSKEVRIIEEIFHSYNLETHFHKYTQIKEYYIIQEIFLRFLQDFSIPIKRSVN